MEQRFALNCKLKQQQPLVLIELAIMQLLLMVQQQLMHQHLPAKLIYQHAFGMGIQDAQVEDAHHISDFKLHVKRSLLPVKHVGNYQVS